ncbi:MAG: MBL fold metallo-hydrolase [Synergistaceae bacterium]|nr:MBL fold metallo-hydrolase [Synergistaceae bacterium]
MTRFILAVLIAALSFSSASAFEIVTLIDRTGTAKTDILLGASEAETAKYYPDGEMPSQVLAFLVKTKGGGILFDTGLPDGRIAEELTKNGLAPEDVRTILLTHLHGDHYGGLVNAEGKAAFPNAEVYVSKPEYDYWVNELKDKKVISALSLYDVRQFIFGDEVVDGVRAIDTTGHTPGHVSYLVEDDGGKIIIAGDIIHFQTIQLANPEVAVKYDVDPEKAVQSRKFLFGYAAQKKIPVAGMHIIPPGIINLH